MVKSRNLSKTKRYDMKKAAKYRFFVGILIFVIGFVFEVLDIFSVPNIGTLSFSKWLILTGGLLIGLGVRNFFYGKEIVIDERVSKIINKSSRLTLVAVIYLFLGIFIVSMIKPINVELSLFVSYVIFFIIMFSLGSKYYYGRKI